MFERIETRKTIVKASRKGILLLLVLGFPLAGPATETTNTIRLDNSDWWSANRSPDSDNNIKPEKREFAAANFQILGIDLNDTMFSKAAAQLGTSTIIERGDASTGRHQACYVSSGDKQQVHLIFEQGEVEWTFYVFSGGRAWQGSDQCVTSKRVAQNLATASGLRLGQTPAQVVAILGKPTKRQENELTYFFSIKKKASAGDLRQARQQNPGMSEKDLQENYGFYDLNAAICARFTQSKLTYLAVSKSETN
jgi:hypothetical protein